MSRDFAKTIDQPITSQTKAHNRIASNKPTIRCNNLFHLINGLDFTSVFTMAWSSDNSYASGMMNGPLF